MPSQTRDLHYPQGSLPRRENLRVSRNPYSVEPHHKKTQKMTAFS